MQLLLPACHRLCQLGICYNCLAVSHLYMCHHNLNFLAMFRILLQCQNHGYVYSHCYSINNSHSTTWRYNITDDNGEAVEVWADSCDFTLIHDAKLPKSFNSAAWKQGYNPDLIFASKCIANSCKK